MLEQLKKIKKGEQKISIKTKKDSLKVPRQSL